MAAKKNTVNPDDLIALFRRIVGTVEDDEDTVEVPTILARQIANLLVQKPAGRWPKSGRVKVAESVVVVMARARKQELLRDEPKAAGKKLKAIEADWQAADEAKKKLPGLKASTIKDRITRRKRR